MALACVRTSLRLYLNPAYPACIVCILQLHCESVRAIVPSSASVHCLGDAGFFIDAKARKNALFFVLSMFLVMFLPRQARDTMNRTTHPIRVFLHIICVSQSVNGRSVYRESMSYAFHMHNATGSVNEECIASKAGADDLAWMCMFADCEPPSLSHNIITACIRCSRPDTVLTDASRCCVRCWVRCRVLCCVLALQTPCLTSTRHSS